MLFTGFIVFAAGALVLAKLKRRWLLKALNHDLLLDLADWSATSTATGTFRVSFISIQRDRRRP